MPSAPTPITPYATPPSSSDPTNFDARADAKVLADQTFVVEANALAANVYANAVEAVAGTATAVASAASASANAAAAANYAAAPPWASGNYSADVSARSTVDHRIYIARTTGAKPTDPSLDPTNWQLATGNGLQLVPVTGTAATAAAGGRYVLKNAAATTLTAPPAPNPGDEFAVKWVNGRFDNVINWNGAKCEGLSDATTTLNGSRRGAAHFAYIDSTTGWGAI